MLQLLSYMHFNDMNYLFQANNTQRNQQYLWNERKTTIKEEMFYKRV